MQKILYFGWLGHSNIGDELMWDIFRELFAKNVPPEKYKLIPSTRNIRKRLKNDNNYLKSFDIIVLGGGSILMPYFANTLYKAIKLRHDIRIFIWGSGIDWIERKDLNHYFLKSSHNKSELKNEFNRFPRGWFRQKLQFVLNHCEVISLRGFYTYEILKQKGIQLSNALVSGDPGLLLDPLLKGVPITRQKDLVTVNWGTAMNRLYGRNEAKLEAKLIKVINKLVDKGYKICIYPVWNKDIRPCIRLYHKLKNKENITLIKTLLKQHKIMKLYQKSAFSINLKLHANVLSAVTKTPFVAMGYRFKTFDFANFIGLDELVVPTDDPRFAKNTLKAIELIEEKGEDLMKGIDKQQEYSQTNLSRIFKLL